MKDTFSALSNTNRLRMVIILLRGPLNVSEISRVLHLSQSNVSHHLRLLLDAGIVLRHSGGGWVYYRLNRADRFTASVIGSIESGQERMESRQRDMEELGRCYLGRRLESREFFDSVADEWDARSSLMPDPAGYLPCLREALPREGIVLDAGCGSGGLLARLSGSGLRLIGVDQSPEMLSAAAKRLAGTPGGETVELRLGNAEHLPAADASVDGVIAHMVLHHLGEPSLFFSEASRVLRSGGVCITVELAPHEDASLRSLHGDLWPGLDRTEITGWMTAAGLSPEGADPCGDGRSYMVTGRLKTRNGKEDR